MASTESYNSTMCAFAEAMFQKMASDRYGIEFCCSLELESLKLEKEKLELNDLCLNTK